MGTIAGLGVFSSRSHWFGNVLNLFSLWAASIFSTTSITYLNFWWFIQFLVMLHVMFFLVAHNYLWSGQAFSFLIGIVLAQYSDKKIHLSKAWLIGGLGLLLGLLSLALKQTDFIRQSNYLLFNTNQVILNVAAAMGLIFLLYPLLKLKMIQLFALAGTASYEIYLVHTLLIFMIKDRLSVTNVILYVFVCGVVVMLFYWGNWRVGRVGKGHTYIK